MNNDIIIVGGLGRCGSTLMMRLLDVCGIPIYALNKVSYEDDRTIYITPKDTWLKEAEGKAIKILDLQRMSLPKEFNYKIIWMKRDFVQQAKSQIKFAKIVAQLPAKNSDWKKMYHSLLKDEKKAFEKILKNNYQYTIIEFEKLFDYNTFVYEMIQVQELIGTTLDLHKVVAGNVIINRSTECQPGIDIEASFVK